MSLGILREVLGVSDIFIHGRLRVFWGEPQELCENYCQQRHEVMYPTLIEL